MLELQLPAGEEVFAKQGKVALFHQLGVKVDLTSATTARYFSWLDDIKCRLPQLVPGAEIGEKARARTSPVLNTGVYYDSSDYQLLGTGSLLRTTCAVTHAFCAFKLADDGKHVRKDHRYVFQGRERGIIRGAPASGEAVAIVRRLLARTDIEHPGTFLYRYHGIDPTTVTPAVLVKRYISTFWVWLDKRDALRCSLDRVYAEIAKLINEVLEISDVEVDDNFFDVGGNSLLALRLMAKLEAQCGAKVSLLDVVRAPTPHELASLIAGRGHYDTNPGAAKAE